MYVCVYRTQIYIKRKFEICSKCFSTQFYILFCFILQLCSAQTSCFILKHVNTGRKTAELFLIPIQFQIPEPITSNNNSTVYYRKYSLSLNVRITHHPLNRCRSAKYHDNVFQSNKTLFRRRSVRCLIQWRTVNTDRSATVAVCQVTLKQRRESTG